MSLLTKKNPPQSCVKYTNDEDEYSLEDITETILKTTSEIDTDDEDEYSLEDITETILKTTCEIDTDDEVIMDLAKSSTAMNTNGFVTNVFRGSSICDYETFDEKKPSLSYVEYAADEAKRFRNHIENLTENVLKTTSENDTIDEVIMDLAESATTVNTNGFVMNVFRGSLICVFQEFDEENPPESYIQYAKDEEERFFHHLGDITETILKTPSEIDDLDEVIMDLAESANTLLFIMIGRFWSQYRGDKTNEVDDLWKNTSKTLILFDDSLSKWVQHLKKHEPAVVSIFGFEEDEISRQRWIQLFKEVYDSIFKRKNRFNFDKIKDFLSDDEKKGTKELKEAFIEHIKMKIVDIKKLTYNNTIEVKIDKNEDTYHVPTCNDIVNLAANAYTIVYTRIEILRRCARSENWKNKEKIDALWKSSSENLSLFNNLLLDWLQLFPKDDLDAQSILGFEINNNRQPWIKIFAELYDRFSVRGYPYFLKNDFDQMRNCLPDNEKSGNYNEVFEAFIELIKIKIDKITKLFYVKPIEEVTYNNSKFSVYKINNYQDEEAVKLSERTSNNDTQPSDVSACNEFLELAKRLHSNVKMKINSFLAQHRIKNKIRETLEILSLLETNPEARSEIGFGDYQLKWIKILRKLNDRYFNGYTYFLESDFKEMEKCLEKTELPRENSEVLENFGNIIKANIDTIEFEKRGKVKFPLLKSRNDNQEFQNPKKAKTIDLTL